MILEIASFTIKEGQQNDFETAFEQAQQRYLSVSKGYLKHQLLKGIENPSNYTLLVHWQTLEDHTIGFRESEQFVHWREIIGPYFAETPVVYHHQFIGNTT